MPIDTAPERTQIETGRSWRDLPPSPPATMDVRGVQPQAEVPAPAEPPRRPWKRMGIGAVALIVGIAVGIWAPWNTGEEPRPLAADALPESIVPDSPEEFGPSAPSSAPEASPQTPPATDAPESFFDQLPEDFFDQLPEGLFDDFGGLGGAADDVGLISIDILPSGYQTRSNVFSGSEERASQRIRVLGPDGPVDIQAISGPDVVLPSGGDPHDVAGAEGRITRTATSTTISWLAAAGLLITIEAPEAVAGEVLDSIAQGVEVTK